MTIRTERLHISTLNYYETVSRVYSHIGMVQSQEEEDNFKKFTLDKMKEAPETDQKWYGIWDARDSQGELILECGFICPPTSFKAVEVYCYTIPEHQGKGYGTEAIIGLTKFATSFDIKYICASVAKENKASQKMMLNAGYYYLADSPEGMMVFNKILKN